MPRICYLLRHNAVLSLFLLQVDFEVVVGLDAYPKHEDDESFVERRPEQFPRRLGITAGWKPAKVHSRPPGSFSLRGANASPPAGLTPPFRNPFRHLDSYRKRRPHGLYQLPLIPCASFLLAPWQLPSRLRPHCPQGARSSLSFPFSYPSLFRLSSLFFSHFVLWVDKMPLKLAPKPSVLSGRGEFPVSSPLRLGPFFGPAIVSTPWTLPISPCCDICYPTQ